MGLTKATMLENAEEDRAEYIARLRSEYPYLEDVDDDDLDHFIYLSEKDD